MKKEAASSQKEEKKLSNPGLPDEKVFEDIFDEKFNEILENIFDENSNENRILSDTELKDTLEEGLNVNNNNNYFSPEDLDLFENLSFKEESDFYFDPFYFFNIWEHCFLPLAREGHFEEIQDDSIKAELGALLEIERALRARFVFSTGFPDLSRRPLTFKNKRNHIISISIQSNKIIFRDFRLLGKFEELESFDFIKKNQNVLETNSFYFNINPPM